MPGFFGLGPRADEPSQLSAIVQRRGVQSGDECDNACKGWLGADVIDNVELGGCGMLVSAKEITTTAVVERLL